MDILDEEIFLTHILCIESISNFKGMFRKLLIVSAISSSAFISPIAMADTSDSGFYLTAGIGTGLETDVDGSVNGTDFTAKGRTTFDGGLGLGYDFDNRWRVEAGLSRGSLNFKNLVIDGKDFPQEDNESATGLSLSAAYDFENDYDYCKVNTSS